MSYIYEITISNTLRIRFILPCSESDLKSRKYQLFFYFFFYKEYISPKYDLFCYLWGK